MSEKRILYCHCAYSGIISDQVKNKVLARLAASDVAFEAVADLCEMSARKDPMLERLAASDGDLRIAACYPRAVKWLFSAAGTPLPKEGVTIHNMRTEDPDETVEGLLAAEPRPQTSPRDESEPKSGSDSDSDSDSDSNSDEELPLRRDVS